jgi:hypothetical protein
MLFLRKPLVMVTDFSPTVITKNVVRLMGSFEVSFPRVVSMGDFPAMHTAYHAQFPLSIHNSVYIRQERYMGYEQNSILIL